MCRDTNAQALSWLTWLESETLTQAPTVTWQSKIEIQKS
jgi:hypothetical protein